MQNSLLHPVKINRGCFTHGLRKSTVDDVGLHTAGLQELSRMVFQEVSPVAGTLTTATSFAMWLVSQTSHPRDVISHASITLSQDSNKLGIFLRKQTLSIRQQMFHICCADVQGLKA